MCNPPTYPNFLAFLAELKIPTSKTEMTFSVSRDGGLFEWAGKGLPSVFCQTRNLYVPLPGAVPPFSFFGAANIHPIRPFVPG